MRASISLIQAPPPTEDQAAQGASFSASDLRSIQATLQLSAEEMSQWKPVFELIAYCNTHTVEEELQKKIPKFEIEQALQHVSDDLDRMQKTVEGIRLFFELGLDFHYDIEELSGERMCNFYLFGTLKKARRHISEVYYGPTNLLAEIARGYQRLCSYQKEYETFRSQIEYKWRMVAKLQESYQQLYRQQQLVRINHCGLELNKSAGLTKLEIINQAFCLLKHEKQLSTFSSDFDELPKDINTIADFREGEITTHFDKSKQCHAALDELHGRQQVLDAIYQYKVQSYQKFCTEENRRQTRLQDPLLPLYKKLMFTLVNFLMSCLYGQNYREKFWRKKQPDYKQVRKFMFWDVQDAVYEQSRLFPEYQPLYYKGKEPCIRIGVHNVETAVEKLKQYRKPEQAFANRGHKVVV